MVQWLRSSVLGKQTILSLDELGALYLWLKHRRLLNRKTPKNGTQGAGERFQVFLRLKWRCLTCELFTSIKISVSSMWQKVFQSHLKNGRKRSSGLKFHDILLPWMICMVYNTFLVIFKKFYINAADLKSLDKCTSYLSWAWYGTLNAPKMQVN